MLADELRLTYRQAHGIAPAPVESAKSNPFEATFSTKVYTGTRRSNTATIRLTQLCVVSLCCPNLNPNHCRPCNANQRRRRYSSSRCVLSTAHLNCAFTLQLYYSNKSFVIFCDVCSAHSSPPFDSDPCPPLKTSGDQTIAGIAGDTTWGGFALNEALIGAVTSGDLGAAEVRSASPAFSSLERGAPPLSSNPRDLQYPATSVFFSGSVATRRILAERAQFRRTLYTGTAGSRR